MGVTIDILVKQRTAELEDLIARYSWLVKREMPKILNATAVRFLRAALRATPPGEGKTTIPGEALYRPIKDLSRPGQSRYRVYFRTKNAKGPRYFSERSEAESFSAIMNRGAAKYGWAGALVDMGYPLPRIVPRSFPYASRGPILAAKLSKGYPADMTSPVAEVRNAADYVSLAGMNAGLRIANLGLKQGIKRLEEDIANGLR